MAAFPGRRPQTLLELNLTEPLVSPEADDPIARLRARSRRLLRPTLRALHEAAEDRHVVGLIAKVGGAWPWGAMQELRLGIEAFVASGKPGPVKGTFMTSTPRNSPLSGLPSVGTCTVRPSGNTRASWSWFMRGQWRMLPVSRWTNGDPEVG